MRLREVNLLIASQDLGDAPKARLPLQSARARAAVDTAALAVEPYCPSLDDSGHFGDDLWPDGSLLIRYEVGGHGRRKCDRGLVDFCGLRAWAVRGGQ